MTMKDKYVDVRYHMSNENELYLRIVNEDE